MKHHHLFVVIGIISAGAGQARAGEHDGWAVGPRAEGSFYGAGADYWRGPLAVVATVNGIASHERESSPALPTSEAWRTGLGASAGVLFALVDGPRARLALGGRVAYRRERVDFGDAGVWTYDALALQTPLRIQLWVTDRVTVHTEVGLELGMTGGGNSGSPGVASSEGNRQYLGTFGHPLGNFGVSYCF